MGRDRKGGGWGEGGERERQRERRPIHEHGRVILEFYMNRGLYRSVDRETERERGRLLRAYRRVHLNCICTLDCIGMLIEKERERERERERHSHMILQHTKENSSYLSFQPPSVCLSHVTSNSATTSHKCHDSFIRDMPPLNEVPRLHS